MVVLVGGEDEEGVRLVDAISRQAREKGAEGLVVVGQLRLVVGLTWT